MPDIVISEFMDDAAVDTLRCEFDVLYDRTLVDQPDRLRDLAAEARALIVRNRTAVRGPLLERAGRLLCVGRLGVGLDNIDTETCAARGIAVLPATGANVLAVAEYVITAAMILLRGSWLSTAEMVAGAWPREQLVGRELSGKTMGLIGFGEIGREVAVRAGALGMQCIAHDPHLHPDDPRWALARRVALAELLAEADAVSIHTPLTPDTIRLLDRNALAAMRPDAVLINTSRGGIVDEVALIDALRAGSLAGAALDVFENEPLAAASGSRFEGIRNLILTPHIAGVTAESNVRVSRLVADRVRSHLLGTP